MAMPKTVDIYIVFVFFADALSSNSSMCFVIGYWSVLLANAFQISIQVHCLTILFCENKPVQFNKI